MKGGDMENIPIGSVAAYTVGPDGPSEGYRRGGGAHLGPIQCRTTAAINMK